MKYTLLINQARTIRSVRINATGEIINETTNPERYADLAKKAKQALNRKQRDKAMESLGLVKVKGAISGKTYWE